MLRKKFISFGIVLLMVGILLGMQIGSAISGDNTYQYLKKLENAFLLINEHYVEDVDSAELAEGAIRGMLEDLDPHSVYIDAETMERVSEEFDASFEGIGIQFELIGPEDKDTVTVVSVIPGGPSEEVGLMSGDRIVEIDGASAIGFTSEDVQKHLKGPRGTKVEVGVRRPGNSEQLSFTITRDRIPLETVDAAYMINDETGYIKLNRFARTTYREFMEAMEELKGQGMERLVLDLRGNAGGFMDMAIRISDEFLSEGQAIVSARSRHPEFNQAFRAHAGGTFETQPVIVLVDEGSASASEIVAGALQDHDRALIIGRRTFGKGLVQRQYPLADGSALRMTISRYYTPSGRLIQTPYADGDKEEYYTDKLDRRKEEASLSAEEILEQVPDSLKFRTDAGRVVFGGGGILPDFIVQPDSISGLVRAMLTRNLETPFVRQWLDTHGKELHAEWDGERAAFIRDFEVSDEMFDAFLAFADKEGVKVGEGPKPQAGASSEGPVYFSRADVEADRHVLETLLKRGLARRLFDWKAAFPVMHEIDHTFKEAMRLWEPAEKLAMNYTH